MDKQEIKREIILSHYEKPENFLKSKKGIDKTYKSAKKNSPSCIDNLTLYLKIDKNKIVDAKFSGVGCAISTSSTDILCSILKNKTVEQAKKILDNYIDMVSGKKYDKKILDVLFAYEDVHKQFNRINCAKIGAEGIKIILNKI